MVEFYTLRGCVVIFAYFHCVLLGKGCKKIVKDWFKMPLLLVFKHLWLQDVTRTKLLSGSKGGVFFRASGGLQLFGGTCFLVFFERLFKSSSKTFFGATKGLWCKRASGIQGLLFLVENSCVPTRLRSARNSTLQAEEGAVEAEEGDEDDDGTVARQKCAPWRNDLFEAYDFLICWPTILGGQGLGGFGKGTLRLWILHMCIFII